MAEILHVVFLDMSEITRDGLTTGNIWLRKGFGMAEHRRRPRKNTPHLVKAVDAESGKTVGRIVDITADGLMLVAPGPLDIGRRIQLRIILPVIVDNCSEIHVETEVVWCDLDQNPSFFKIGCSFINLAGYEGFLLEDVMHRFNLVG